MKFRVGALLLGAILITAAPASAQSATAGARSFVASSTATGLELTIGGQGLVVGHTTAGLRSGTDQEGGCAGEELTCATAAAIVGVNDTAAGFPGNEGPNTGTLGELPEPLSDLVELVVGPADAVAAAQSAQGDAGAVRVSLTATRTLTEQAPQIQDGLRQVSEGLLGPIAEGDPSGEVGPRLKATVDALIDNLNVSPLATIDVMPSQASVIDEGTRVCARGVGKGVVVALSPSPVHTAITPEALVIVEVGVADVTACSDGTVESDPASVRIKIFNPVTGEYDVVEVPPGDTTCVLEGTPLQVCVGLGSATANAEGGGAGSADGVTIEALADPAPELVLGVGQADVGASQTIAEAPPGPVPGPDLPTTGGGLALPALGLLGVGTLGVAALRRRTF